MGLFRITVDFSLETRIEPEGISFYRSLDSVTDLDDSSRWSESDVESEGGNVSFTIEADDLDAARHMVDDMLGDGTEFEDTMGFTWTTSGVNVEIEELTPPMDRERALVLLRGMLDRLVVAGHVSSEEQEATLFLIDLIPAGDGA